PPRAVGHGADAPGDPEGVGDRAGRGREGGAGAEEERAMQVGREVTVAETEPRLAPEPLHGLEAVKGIVPPPPAPRTVEKAREGVGARIEVGGNAKPPPVQIVPGVADD